MAQAQLLLDFGPKRHLYRRGSIVIYNINREGDWTYFVGNLKSLNNARYLNASHIRVITSFDQVCHHFLQCMVHSISSSSVGNVVNMFNFIDRMKKEASSSSIQPAINTVLSECREPQGLHKMNVVRALHGKFDEKEILSTIAWMIEEGYLYTTLDEDHIKKI